MLKYKYPILILLTLAALWLFARYTGLTINDSASMPIGLYIKTNNAPTAQIKRGDIVSLCLAKPYKMLGLQKFYIEKGRACKGAVALIKSVLAVPGDTVLLTNEFVRVNETTYSYHTKHVDSYGKALAVYPRGLYRNITGFFVIGTNSPNSWDSRYFGFIQPTQVIAILRPIITWQ